jgi:hypothetical protein
MNSAELDRLWQRAGRKIVSAEITSGSGPLTDEVYDQARRVIATFDDGSQLELFSFYAHERSFAPTDFIGSTVDEARALKCAPSHCLPLNPNAATAS